MRRFTLLAAVAVGSVALGVAVAPLAAMAAAPARTAQDIITEYRMIQTPKPDRSKLNDEGYVEQYKAQVAAVEKRREPLVFELLKLDPANKALVPWFSNRWSVLAVTDMPKLMSETEEIAGSSKSADLVKLAKQAKAQAMFQSADRQTDPAARKAGFEQFVAAYPDSPMATIAKGKVRQIDGIGKPFELKFTDAISGKPVDIAAMKGKIVVVDFWATWCGPCIAKMPELKQLHAEWKSKGVEFVGVSLDNPEESAQGLSKLKAYVAENQIPWVQYYQGNGWDSEFSKSWGLNSIPAMFVIDRKGNLVSTDGHAKLKEIVTGLIGK